MHIKYVFVFFIFITSLATRSLALNNDEFKGLYEGAKKAIDLIEARQQGIETHYVLLGRSPTFIGAVMVELGYQNMTMLPFSDLRKPNEAVAILADPVLKEKAFKHLERFLPEIADLVGKEIALVDIAMTGNSLKNFSFLLKSYLDSKGVHVSQKIYDISNAGAKILLRDIDTNGVLYRVLSDERTDVYAKYGSYMIRYQDNPEKTGSDSFLFFRSVIRSLMQNDPWALTHQKSEVIGESADDLLRMKHYADKHEVNFLLQNVDPKDIQSVGELSKNVESYHQIMSVIEREPLFWSDQIDFFSNLVPFWKKGNPEFYRRVFRILLSSPQARTDVAVVDKILALRSQVQTQLGYDPIAPTAPDGLGASRNFLVGAWDAREYMKHLYEVALLIDRQPKSKDRVELRQRISNAVAVQMGYSSMGGYREGWYCQWFYTH